MAGTIEQHKESLREKRKSLTNSQSDVVDAIVIANYGDPGLDEDYHFDILSQYVIVMIESAYRIPTKNKWNKMFAIVKRPPHLWLAAEGGRGSSPNSQQRSDPAGNVSVGSASSFTTAGVPRINVPYFLGESIKIKKLAYPIVLGYSPFFTSDFSDDKVAYGNWHSEGSTLPYFAGNSDRTNRLQIKTIFKPDVTKPNQYGITLYKLQYEAFFLNLIKGDQSMTSHATSIFANTVISSNAIYHADGGYVFKNLDYVDFYSCEYEDINIGNKQRVTTNECMPLVVATPSTFPTPKVREIGTILYSPAYSPIAVQS